MSYLFYSILQYSIPQDSDEAAVIRNRDFQNFHLSTTFSPVVLWTAKHQIDADLVLFFF